MFDLAAPEAKFRDRDENEERFSETQEQLVDIHHEGSAFSDKSMNNRDDLEYSYLFNHT